MALFSRRWQKCLTWLSFTLERHIFCHLHMFWLKFYSQHYVRFSQLTSTQQTGRMSNTDVDIDDVTISVNPPKILPRRSSSTAMDIYSEIRQSKEEELRRIIQEQESKIALLENEVTTPSSKAVITLKKEKTKRESAQMVTLTKA